MLTDKELNAIQDYLCGLADDDPKMQEIIKSVGLTSNQMKFISTYVVAGLMAYDKLKSGSAYIKE